MSVPKNKKDMIEKAYDSGAKHYSEYWFLPHETTDAERQEFKKLVPKGSSILDVGCGHGADTEYWYNEGYEVTAIDLSQEMVNLTIARVPGAKVQKLDMRDIDSINDSFNGIWASFSLLHIPSDEASTVLTKMKKVTKPNGYLFLVLAIDDETKFVQTPVTGLTSSSGEQLAPYMQWYTEEDAKTIIEKCGIEIISFRPFNIAASKINSKRIWATVLAKFK